MNNKMGIWNTIITTTIIVVADYFIAKYLADTRSDVWWWISILLFVPLLFTLQVSAVRLIVGRVFLKRNSVNEFVHMMKDGAWPKPNRKYEDCDDYLQDVKNDVALSVNVRLDAAEMYGRIRATFETQQVVSAIQISSAFRDAINEYGRSGEAAEYAKT